MEAAANKNTYRDVDIDGDEGWVCGDNSVEKSVEEVIPDADKKEEIVSNNNDDEGFFFFYYYYFFLFFIKDDDDDDDDIPDMDSYSCEDNVDEATLAVPSEVSNHLVASRTYDISISFDNYYSTPKMWLFGYSEKVREKTKTKKNKRKELNLFCRAFL
jgi:hypothetical protein